MSDARPARQPRVLIAQAAHPDERQRQGLSLRLDGKAKVLGFKDAELDEHGNEVWSVYSVTPEPTVEPA